MKAKKRIRVLRRLAVAGSLITALAVPTASLAKPTSDAPSIPVRHENAVVVVNAPAPHHLTYRTGEKMRSEVQPPAQAEKPYTLPKSFKTEVHTVGQPWSLPASFHTEATNSGRPETQRPFTLPARFQPEVSTPVSSNASSAPAGSVVREIRTVADDGNTLPIVLAAIALAVALGGTAYVAIRQTRMQRNLLGSSSRPIAS